jgi:hypothetical protein
MAMTGCPYCGVGAEDECTMDCPSRVFDPLAVREDFEPWHLPEDEVKRLNRIHDSIPTTGVEKPKLLIEILSGDDQLRPRDE